MARLRRANFVRSLKSVRTLKLTINGSTPLTVFPSWPLLSSLSLLFRYISSHAPFTPASIFPFRRAVALWRAWHGAKSLYMYRHLRARRRWNYALPRMGINRVLKQRRAPITRQLIYASCYNHAHRDTGRVIAGSRTPNVFIQADVLNSFKNNLYT